MAASGSEILYAESPRLTGLVQIKRPACQFDVLVASALLKRDKPHELACLMLGVLTKAYPKIWCELLAHLPKSHWAKAIEGTLCVTIGLVSDEDIRAVNREYRGKDAATDVLSFPAIEPDEAEAMGLLSLPVLELGDIWVSVDWARAHASQSPALLELGNLEQAVMFYMVERVIHGTLHILGIHHDTLSAYNKVIRIQADIMTSLGFVGSLRPSQD
jgi:probable rRNA maturation factor